MKDVQQNITNTKAFYECLFDKEDLAVFGHNIYAIKPTKAITSGVREDKPMFSINPTLKGKTRSIKGVKSFRNFLFEIDEDKNKNKVSLEIQEEIIQASNFPWSTCVFSGNKSLHWILSLETSLEDESEYRVWWLMMESILNKTAANLGYNLKFDAGVKDPCRFSRCPGAVRVDVQQIQQLQAVRGRVNNIMVSKWFDDNDISIEDFLPKPTQFDIGQINEHANDQDKFDFIINTIMKSNPYQQGSRNSWQFAFSRLARRCGIAESNCRNYIATYCEGGVDHRDPVKSAYSDKYSSDEAIYVMTKDERRSHARKQQFREETKVRQEIIESGRSDEYLHANGIKDYVRVGTDFFIKSGEELLAWKKETLTMDFGGDYIAQFPEKQKYKKFVNIVDFVNPIESKGVFYNKFIKPKWPTITPGPMPTTEKLWRKVFSEVGDNQYEDGLDWMQLQLTNPKQMLHCLILGSASREAGKDSFVLWMKMLLGSNNVFFSDIENFLKPFNSPYASKCLIALNEVKFSSINDGSMEKIKQYITQDTVLIDGKFQTPYDLDYHGKMIMLTNNVHDFMKIDDEENRFWLRTMPVLDKNGPDFDPNFMEKLREELPHAIHFLLNRKLHNKTKKSRFWLPEETTHTIELKKIKENSKSNTYLLISEILVELTQTCQNEILYFTNKDIRERISDNNIGPKQITMCMQKEFRLEPTKTVRTNSFTDLPTNSMYYAVKRKDWTDVSTFLPEPSVDMPGLENVFDL
jgi:hypothetical protein